MFTLLDVMHVARQQLSRIYNGVSISIEMITAKDFGTETTLPLDKELVTAILTDLSKLLTSLFVKAALIGQQRMQKLFYHYEAAFREATSANIN